MKHLFRNLLIIAFVVCCNFQQALAQQMPPIPVDPNVRIGKLDNGLTYYIRKNNPPRRTGRLLYRPESRFHTGRREPAWPRPLPRTHVF